ncbi:fanconi-associated nuclease 1-like [Hyposmocoma kahamanoa]|uniref:fanconi-associated nuclease 1-like n=1 Tax=Hyposmocoma kahamanoa TaxID=1477025 RepID=UPI000E6D716B|nr:fanconi-associated nuclease 1-like [Hyposmocoma kahamanoa]
MTFKDFTSILGKDDLKQICKELKLKHVDNKHDAIAALARFSKRSSNISNFLTGHTSNNSSRVLQMMNKKTPPRYKLSDLARSTLYKLYLIMYLGIDFNLIRDRKLEFMLLCEKTLRETYPVNKDMVLDNASIVFRDKDDFERYFTAHLMYEDFLTRVDEVERCEIVKQVKRLLECIDEDEMARYKSISPWLRRFTPPNVYIKMLEAGIQDLKKSKCEDNYQFALDILSTLISQNEFCVHRKAHWYDEKALVLHSNMCVYDQAAEVLIEGFQSDLSEESKDSLRPRARKLAHQKNITISEHLKKKLLEYSIKETILENNLDARHIYKQPMDRTNKRGKVKFETRTAEGRTVLEAEEYCIAHYISSGEFTHGEHWEGRIVTTIYFLLFWDIIYSKPPNAQGVFITYYQMYPLDMFTESFYENRKTRIDEWLDALAKASTDKVLKIMHDTWDNRPKCELSGINRNIAWLDIAMVASCLGSKAVSAICRRLAVNYKYAHSGFPDLTLWNEFTRKIKFVEVKTDTDKPSMKQIQWMHYLREHGIDTEFCYLGANTMRQRCRTVKNQPDVKSEQ